MEDLGEAGLINSIDFKNASDADCTRNIDIYMVNTDKTIFENDSVWISATADDLVFSGEVTFAAGSWTGIELDNPFDYDGQSNVAIIVDDNTGSYVSSINFLAQKTENNSSLYIYDDNTNYNPASPGKLLRMFNNLFLAILSFWQLRRAKRRLFASQKRNEKASKWGHLYLGCAK